LGKGHLVYAQHGDGIGGSGLFDRSEPRRRPPAPASAVAQTPCMANMLSTSYSQTAVTTANSIAVNPASVASVGQAESNFQNVPTANGSTSATGPWQFTQGTFQAVSQQYGLGYTAADITNPEAQAVAAAY
jgi:Transglycosylase SLT domain